MDNKFTMAVVVVLALAFLLSNDVFTGHGVIGLGNIGGRGRYINADDCSASEVCKVNSLKILGKSGISTTGASVLGSTKVNGDLNVSGDLGVEGSSIFNDIVFFNSVFYGTSAKMNELITFDKLWGGNVLISGNSIFGVGLDNLMLGSSYGLVDVNGALNVSQNAYVGLRLYAADFTGSNLKDPANVSNAYACIDPDGKIFRSTTPCA